MMKLLKQTDRYEPQAQYAFFYEPCGTLALPGRELKNDSIFLANLTSEKYKRGVRGGDPILIYIYNVETLEIVGYSDVPVYNLDSPNIFTQAFEKVLRICLENNTHLCFWVFNGFGNLNFIIKEDKVFIYDNGMFDMVEKFMPYIEYVQKYGTKAINE